VAQGGRQLAEIARDLAPLLHHLAGDDVRFADDLSRLGLRQGTDRLGLRAGLLPGIDERPLGLGAGFVEQALSLLAGGRQSPLALAAGAVKQALSLLAGGRKDLLALGVHGAERRQRFVAGGLGLCARDPEDLLRLLLGRSCSILGGAVGLGDPLMRAGLGLLAQLHSGVFSRADDVLDPS